MNPLRVVVLASGEGTNLGALLERFSGGDEGVLIAGVAGDRPHAGALERARAAGVPVAVFTRDAYADRAARDAALAAQVVEWRADLVVLAGYMALLDPGFVDRFEGRIVNVHPSLLPSFPGLRAIEQALEHGVRVTGATVHLVDHGVDTGPILAQGAVDVLPGDTPASLHDRIRPVEHRLLGDAVADIARSRPTP
jgi:phosphoribosylglycinamide formyltransferase-1